MSRSSSAQALLLLGCSLYLVIYLHTADGSVLAGGIDRGNRQHRAMRRSDGGLEQVEDRTNAIDQPLDQALQLKYYDVVQVDLVHSLPAQPDSDAVSLVAAGAGEGQSTDQPAPSSTPTASTGKSESAKTLADQVAEGKYGLIHRELFQRRPQRLGVLNYRRNEEVPLDDERNYGGLRPDEIWLAEDHLLVLKGGSISFGSNRSGADAGGPWQPIDDYRAPDRQVQIPANPAVPPPFPVQLRENGPIEFIRGRQVPAFNPFTNESAFLFTNKAFPVIRPEDFGGQNILAGPAAHNATGQHHTGLQYPPPVNPPPVSDNRTYSNPFLKLPPPGPPFGPPVGGGSLDDVRNRTGPYPVPPGDEDDPSLYYPPPYTFEYRGNYTNPVPPGPLVPGIILPPPPNFFILKPAPGANGTDGPVPAADRPKVTKPPKHYASVRPHPTTTVPPASANGVAPPKIAPSRVEIQKAVLKTFVPVLEVYGAPKSPSKPASKRPRPKPTGAPPTVSTVAATTPLLTPSTKLHKIPPEVGVARPPPPAQAAHPIYAEYFDIRTSTSPPGWNDVGSSPVTPHLPARTYLPVVGTKHRPEPARPIAPATPDYLAGTYGYSPIEQFHREVQTIRQTLQIYEKANKLTKAGRTSKAHQPAPTLTNLSLSFDGNVYRTLFPEEVPQPLHVGGLPTYQQPAYKPPYDPSPAYVYRAGSNSVVAPNLPTGYYVTTTDYGRHATGYGGDHRPQYYQPSAQPPPPAQPDLSYIAPVILNNGASGYNRRPEFDPSAPGTTTKSYLILDHRLPGATRLRPDRQRQPLTDVPYLYRGGGAPSVDQGAGPVRNRYLESDILVNYKHPLPVLNPDSEFLPYHHRLKVRKRQNVRGAGEQKPRYLGQPLYNHR
ncbi:atrophin-1 [Anopheles marshallii]|uniref:atrophin-1 n=1 Tax=Anopheles marshallii TaxID=1521116 RepID=UPI00237B9CA2|nr:atrophin-1 [Anopheles marshallii]